MELTLVFTPSKLTKLVHLMAPANLERIQDAESNKMGPNSPIMAEYRPSIIKTKSSKRV